MIVIAPFLKFVSAYNIYSNIQRSGNLKENLERVSFAHRHLRSLQNDKFYVKMMSEEITNKIRVTFK